MAKDHSSRTRSHTCGELLKKDIGQIVDLCGWVDRRRDHGGLVFVDLRDRYGTTQVVFDPKGPHGERVHEMANKLRSEYVIWCRGVVRERPDGMLNSKVQTGEIEILCEELEVLSESKTPPFPIEDQTEVSEQVRFKYRYLDIRRPFLQKNLITRHRMLSLIRNYLDQEAFIEVETPILYKSTPEGARDFVVPSRLNPGSYYALPQSPQTLKQLLMVGGMDRYYQIARCFRDEDLRSDRQPEFSQIDIEASFLSEKTLFPIIEKMISKLWKDILNIEIKTPFLQMPYQEAMDKYGTDKPDLRFGLEIVNLSEVFLSSQCQIFRQALDSTRFGEKAGSVRAIVVPHQLQSQPLSRKDLDELQNEAKALGAQGLLWIKVLEDGELQSPTARFFSENEKTSLKQLLKLQAGDLVLLVADQNTKLALESLGVVRISLANRMGLIAKDTQDQPAFLWVTHFPLLEYDRKEARYYACHHPFTSPKLEFFEDLLAGRNLENLQASAYDLVLNGVEIGGGSLRIHRPDIQSAMFKALGLSEEQAKEKFGFFLEALQYGAPPHGGIAFGVERLAALLCGVGPIRDVMAFPKTQKGLCLMSSCPSEITSDQLLELKISRDQQTSALT